MKRNVKRILALLLCLALMAGLSGCRRKAALPTATVFTEEGPAEVPQVTMLLDLGAVIERESLGPFLSTIPGYGKEFAVKTEILPGVYSGSERDAVVQRVRTEIMAGNGPDLFIVSCYNTVVLDTGETGGAQGYSYGYDGRGPLFNFPLQAMDSRLFLPLDSYLENARFIEFDQLEPAVMAVGRNQEGQQLLPITFDFDVASYVPAEGAREDVPEDRQEMLYCGHPSVEFAAMGGWGRTLLNVFPQVIDLERDQPGFSEEELLERSMEFWEQRQKDWGWGHGVFFFGGEDDTCGPMSVYFVDGRMEHDAVFVPSYNESGGVTAYVTNYAAINRNANYPDYAFRIIDKLLSRDEMNERRIYGLVLGSLPVYTGAAGGLAALGGSNVSPELRERYRELLDQVDNVRFPTLLDQEMLRSVAAVCMEGDAAREDVEKAVHSTYITMKMMLAES